MNIKHLKKLSLYFVIVLAIVLVCGFTGLVIKEADKGTFYDLATPEALSLCLQLGLVACTALIPYSLSVAAFLSFWAMSDEKWTGFFRNTAIGLVLVLPLSAMTYYYDWFVRPETKAAYAVKAVEIKQTYPQDLVDTFRIDPEKILYDMPMVMPKAKLIARIDSLKASFEADVDTCGLLLSMLPDTLASAAYDSYQLETMGVAYQYAAHPAVGEDSLMFIAHTELYRHAITAWETSSALQRHQEEYSGRTVNTLSIYIVYILFALLGYLLRYKPMKKILMVVAVGIAALWVYHEIGAIVQKHAKEASRVSRQFVDDTYKEIEGIREKERNMDEH